MDTDATATDKNRLISLAEVAGIFGFSQIHLAQLCQRGRLNAKKIGNSWATTLNDVEIYIQSRQKRGAFREDIQGFSVVKNDGN